jgi:hypothetical protein
LKPRKLSPNAERKRDKLLTRRAIHVQRLKRLLPRLADRFGLDVATLEAIAERSRFLCAICVGPLPVPVVFPSTADARALVCGHCMAAYEKTEGDLLKMRSHRRLDPDYVDNRGRIGRIVSILSTDWSL